MTATPKVWYTSDLHLGDPRNAPYRGYSTPEEIDEHDAKIIETIIETVAPGDHLWNLGDISRGGKAGTDHALGLLFDVTYFSKAHKKNPIVQHLIPGNHDRCHPKNPDSWKHQAHALTVFKSVQTFARHKIADRDVMLSHFPYKRDRNEERYGQYRLRDEGHVLLHGHLHVEQRVKGREVHVGWDAWQRPVSQGEIAELIYQI